MRHYRGPDIGVEVGQPFPRPAAQSIGPLQTRDAGFNTRSEVAQLAIHPRALGHLFDLQAAFLIAPVRAGISERPTLRFEAVAVVIEQLVAVFLEQAGPGVLFWHRAGLLVGRLGALVGHLEEQQVGELLNVVAIRHAVVARGSGIFCW